VFGLIVSESANTRPAPEIPMMATDANVADHLIAD
jgi:hypothetical protein